MAYRFSFFVFIISLSFNWLCAQSISEYDQTLKMGDEYYAGGDYINAKASYEYAGRIRPTEEIPKEKLIEVMVILREKMAFMDQYTQVITEADNYFRTEEYELAINKYREASTIIESEGYPEEKIREIEGQKDEVRAKQIAYDDAVYRAEKYLKYNKYDKAVDEYEKALKAIPDDETAKQRILELTAEAEEMERTLEEYDDIVQNADRLFTLKYYENAKEEYQKASEAKPDEDYPNIKIGEINKLLVKRGEYDRLIGTADEFYMSKNLALAKTKYQEALAIYPAENYPKDMIDKTNAALIKERGADVIFGEAIKAADDFFIQKDYVNALKEYENASSIKPVDKYPVKKIAEINLLLEEIENAELNYNMAVKRGEQLLSVSDFANAKLEFEKAKSLKPKEKLPVEKLRVINKSLKAQEEGMASYNQSIEKGQGFLDSGDYENAKLEFENALIIIPADITATSKLNEIKNINNEKVQQKKQYQQFIINGDAFFADGVFTKARNNYVKALTIDASDPYPSDRISEIDQKLKNSRELQNSYDKSIATGDIYFGNQEYEAALAAFQNALSIKSGAAYPEEKITEINSLLQKSDGEDKEYDAAIKEADGLFALQQYAEAKLLYMKAANLKPIELYPKNRIEEIETLLANEATKQAEYNKLIAAAGRLMESGDLDKAKEKYNQALLLYPLEQAPQDKLDEIDRLVLGNEIDIQNRYNELIGEADILFSNQEYDAARIKYQNALKLKPNEGYPVQRLDEMEQLSTDLDKEQDNYSRVIAEADRLFTSGEYQDAKEKYMEASDLFPEEQHPKDRIEEINLLNRADAQNNQLAYDKAIADADKFFASATYSKALDSYRQALAIQPDESHPSQMIEKINKILDDNAVRKILSSTITIQNNDEEKFNFEPLDASDRRGSVLIIRARGIASRSFKVFVNFGKGGSKNGGYIIPVTPGDKAEEFIIPLGKQNKWFTEDNNWFKLIPQGGSIEVSRIEIVKE